MRRSRPLRDLGLAITTLTVVPLSASWPDEERPDPASYYVWAGLIVGAAAYVPLKALQVGGAFEGLPTGLMAAIVLVVWGFLTRFLHWDGLADTADGWFASDPEARRTIASDSSVGAFGATSIALAALLEFAAISAILAEHETLILVVPALARLAGTAGAWFGKAAKPSGLGAAVTGRPSPAGIASAVLGVVVLAVVLGVAYGGTGVAVGVSGLVLALGVPHGVSMRFGGVTGDGLGASILVVEVTLFVVAAVVM